jgi:hypothetical protein
VRIRWFIQTVTDLEHLHRYIAKDNPQAEGRSASLPQWLWVRSRNTGSTGPSWRLSSRAAPSILCILSLDTTHFYYLAFLNILSLRESERGVSLKQGISKLKHCSVAKFIYLRRIDA